MWDYDDFHEQLILQQRQMDEQRMQSVVEEAFEVQTYQPFHGWVFDRFCDRSGNTFPAVTAAAAHIADDNKLSAIKEEDLENMEIGVLPSNEWMWSHPWLPDIEYTHCDEEGWTYGSTIARINRRLAEGTSKIKREYYHFVRRRRWIRTRVKKPTAVAPTTAAAGCLGVGADDSTNTLHTDGDAEGDVDVDGDAEGDLIPTVPTNRYYRVYRDSLFVHFRVAGPTRLAQLVKVPFFDDDVLREGWLGQRGSFSRSWKLRYFLLRSDTSTLVCLRDRASLVALCEMTIDRHTSTLPEKSPNPNQFQFLVINGQHKLRLNAVDELSRDRWVSALSELIVRKRASFLAAEDSDSVHNGGMSVRTRSLRRMRSSWRSDDGSGGWIPPAFAKIPSGPVADGNDPRDDSATRSSHSKRREWRPYKLIASTMHSVEDKENAERRRYVDEFKEHFTTLLHATRDFLDDNIDILEENLRVAEQVLTSAVAKVPVDELQKRRDEVNTAFFAMVGRLEQLLACPYANVLQCNMLRKELYVEAKRLNDLTLSFAPPVQQATVKKVAPESDSKRRIPTDWFMGSTSSESIVEKPETSKAASTHASRLSDQFNYEPMASMGLESGRKKRHSITSSSMDSIASFLTSASSTVLLTTTFAGKSEPVVIKAFRPLPPALCEGHLELPDGVNGYVFFVHETDLGSLISFTLCSEAYVDAVESHFDHAVALAQVLKTEEFTLNPEMGKRHSHSIDSSTELLYLNKLRSSDVQHTEVKFAYDAASTRHEFKCVTFFASQFHALRALAGHGNVNFLCSLAQSRPWETSGGKSGAYFSLTHDKRYVVKGIPVTEFNMFLHMAPHYFKFMSKIVKTPTPTVITKILGLFKLTHVRKLPRQTTYVVVMENISYGVPPGQVYDIKGITRRRYSGPGSESEQRDSGSFTSRPPLLHSLPVLLDGDLMERIPIPVRMADLDVVESAIQNDTGFLCRAGVVDYSLLMVFDEANRQVVVGLIDYLHQFDFLKKMESTSKASLTFRNPTIISPPSYRTRFVNATHRYLVGIELELELRIRKRTSAAKKHKNKKTTNTNISNGTVLADKVVSGRRVADRPTSTSTTEREQRQPHRSDRAQSLPMMPRAKSDAGGTCGGMETMYDRHAERAHSDGEDYSSVSSDEACIRESPAIICALMPQEEHR